MLENANDQTKNQCNDIASMLKTFGWRENEAIFMSTITVITMCAWQQTPRRADQLDAAYLANYQYLLLFIRGGARTSVLSVRLIENN